MSGPTGRKLSRARLVALIRRLMTHGCTKGDLARRMGMSRTCAGDWVNALHRGKCIHIVGYSETIRLGCRAAIYRWGEADDAPKPLGLTSVQRTAKWRDKSTIDRAWKMPRPPKDPA